MFVTQRVQPETDPTKIEELQKGEAVAACEFSIATEIRRLIELRGEVAVREWLKQFPLLF